MLLSFNETSELIAQAKHLHISGAEDLLKKLPKGNWIGGSTEYFMTKKGGVVTGEELFVTELSYDTVSIKVYDENDIQNITADAYDNGFTILILPFDSVVHKFYADQAPEFDNIYSTNIVGWISGVNLGKSGQTPITVNGETGEVYTNKAVALHVCVPDGKFVSIGIINIFEQDHDSQVIEFKEEGFSVTSCLIDGREVVFADYIEKNNIDTKLPIVGDYSGAGVNVSFKAISGGIVNFYAPVFPDIKYKMAKPVKNYEEAFNSKLKSFSETESAFSCNCILNFLYGELEGKEMEAFYGPITFGEIAYQLVNQTLVYVTVV